MSLYGNADVGKSVYQNLYYDRRRVFPPKERGDFRAAEAGNESSDYECDSSFQCDCFRKQ